MSEPHSNNHHRDPGPQVHRITEAQESHSVEQHSRVLKYTISMSVRLACFIAAFFVHGWLQWVFLAGAIVLPYIAVVIANGGADLTKRQPPAEFYEPGDPHLLTSGFTASDAKPAPAAPEDKAEDSAEHPFEAQDPGSTKAKAQHGDEDPSTFYEEGDIMSEPETASGESARTNTSATWPSTSGPNGGYAGGFPAEAPTTIDGSFVEHPDQPAPDDGQRDGVR